MSTSPFPDVATHPLAAALDAAVPLWIEEIRGRSFTWRQARASECAQVIAEHGDIIMFKSSKKGETADAFNRLAEGIACLAYAPGGVRVLGRHWNARTAVQLT